MGGADPAHARQDAGPGNQAALDRVAHGGRPEGALARVADGRDARADVLTQMRHALERLVKRGLGVLLVEVVTEAEHQVRVAIDHAGEHRGLREIDGLGARRRRHGLRGPHRDDAVTVHEETGVS